MNVWKRLTAGWVLPIWELFSSSLRMLSAAQCACTMTWSMEVWTRYTCIARRGGMTSQLPCSDGLSRLSAWRPDTALLMDCDNCLHQDTQNLIGDLTLSYSWIVTTVCIKEQLGELIQHDGVAPSCSWHMPTGRQITYFASYKESSMMQHTCTCCHLWSGQRWSLRCSQNANFWIDKKLLVHWVHARAVSIPACWLQWGWCASKAAPWRRAGQERQRYATDVPRLPFRSLQALQNGLIDWLTDVWMDEGSDRGMT